MLSIGVSRLSGTNRLLKYFDETAAARPGPGLRLVGVSAGPIQGGVAAGLRFSF